MVRSSFENNHLSGYFDIGGGQVPWLLYPARDNPQGTMVVIHRFSGAPTNLANVAIHAQEKGWTTFAPHHSAVRIPQHPESKVISSYLGPMLNGKAITTIEAVSEAQKNLGLPEPVIVTGHSQGGLLALAVARHIESAVGAIAIAPAGSGCDLTPRRLALNFMLHEPYALRKNNTPADEKPHLHDLAFSVLPYLFSHPRSSWAEICELASVYFYL